MGVEDSIEEFAFTTTVAEKSLDAAPSDAALSEAKEPDTSRKDGGIWWLAVLICLLATVPVVLVWKRPQNRGGRVKNFFITTRPLVSAGARRDKKVVAWWR